MKIELELTEIEFKKLKEIVLEYSNRNKQSLIYYKNLSEEDKIKNTDKIIEELDKSIVRVTLILDQLHKY